MSIEDAREELLAAGWAWHGDQDKVERKIDRLILEVQAKQWCARTWEPKHRHGAWNPLAEDRSCLAKPRFCMECGAKIDPCPSCTARMKLKETADGDGH